MYIIMNNNIQKNNSNLHQYTHMENQYYNMDKNNFNCCEKCDLWCFHNSSIGLYTEHGSNTWCKCFDCCSTCFEYKVNLFSENEKIISNNDDDLCEILCCCITFIIL